MTAATLDARQTAAQAEPALTRVPRHLFLVTSLATVLDLAGSLTQFYLTGLSAIQYKVSKSAEYLAGKQLGSQIKALAITLGK